MAKHPSGKLSNKEIERIRHRNELIEARLVELCGNGGEEVCQVFFAMSRFVGKKAEAYRQEGADFGYEKAEELERISRALDDLGSDYADAY